MHYSCVVITLFNTAYIYVRIFLPIFWKIRFLPFFGLCFLCVLLRIRCYLLKLCHVYHIFCHILVTLCHIF